MEKHTQLLFIKHIWQSQKIWQTFQLTLLPTFSPNSALGGKSKVNTVLLYEMKNSKIKFEI
jgi:hypothetical protein